MSTIGNNPNPLYGGVLIDFIAGKFGEGSNIIIWALT